jgi:hypothetical protein
MSASPTPVRDRLLPWITALEARSSNLTDRSLQATVDVLVAHLSAVHGRDVDRLASTMADDVLVRIWGWTPDEQWSFRGKEAREAYARWFASIGDSLVSMRVDIDRFFPADGILGIDGVWSTLSSGESLGGMAAGLESAATYLVARRVAWFGTIRDGAIESMDLYWSIHQTTDLADRAT